MSEKEPSKPIYDTPKKIAEQFTTPEDNYLRLRGDIQHVRLKPYQWDTDFVLEKYTQATDRVIGRLDGTIPDRVREDPDNPERSKEKPDVVIWLDKSARPVSWFVDAMWDQFADKNAVKPDYEFLNIDRVNWFIDQGHDIEDAKRRLGPSDFDIGKVSDEQISRLRAIFTIGDITEDNWQTDVWKSPTRLDGKNILIVDEVVNKGGTLSIAQQLLKRAIPEATVSADYFWEAGTYSITGTGTTADELQMESAPVWYDNNLAYGRGVGDISAAYYEQKYEREPSQVNLKNKLGWIALSAPHHAPETYELKGDHLADQLKQDIAYLSYAVANREVRHLNGRGRSLEQFQASLDEQGIDFQANRDFSSERAKKNTPR